MNRHTIIATLALLATTATWAQTTNDAPQSDTTKAPIAQQEQTTPQSDTTAMAVVDAPMADYTAPKKYIIRNITAEGIKFLDPEMQINSSGLARGRVYFNSACHRYA